MKNLTKEEKYNKIIEFIHEHKRLPRRNEDTELYMIYSALQQSSRIAQEKKKNHKKIGKIAKKNILYYDKMMEVLHLYKPSKIEKLELLLDYIKKNHHLPTSNVKEKVCYNDGTDMRGLYDAFLLQTKQLREKQQDNLPLSENEMLYLEYGNKIEEEIANWKMTTEEKVEELIKFIKKNHRLPRAKQVNKGQVEVMYRDNTSMSVFQLWIYSEANRIKRKQNNGQILTFEEQRIIYFKQMIQQALKEKTKKTEEKTEQLIKFIEKNHRLPKFKYYNQNESEKTFDDGTDMRNFYHALVYKTHQINKKLENNESITTKDQKDLDSFNKIQQALSKNTVSKEEKLELLLNFIKENHRLPKIKRNTGVNEVLYNDNTGMGNFYASIQYRGKQALEMEREGKKLTKSQEQNKAYYQKLFLTLEIYNRSKNTEVENIINYIEMLGKNASYEEMILLCEKIIEEKGLGQEDSKKLRSVFQRYIECIYQQPEEQQKIKCMM